MAIEFCSTRDLNQSVVERFWNLGAGDPEVEPLTTEAHDDSKYSRDGTAALLDGKLISVFVYDTNIEVSTHQNLTSLFFKCINLREHEFVVKRQFAELLAQLKLTHSDEIRMQMTISCDRDAGESFNFEKNFWLQLGFTSRNYHLDYTGQVTEYLLSPTETEYCVERYDGKNLDLNIKIANILNRMYSRLEGTTQTDHLAVSATLARLNQSALLLYKKDDLVGYMRVYRGNTDYFVCDLALSFKAWGKVAADYLVKAMMNDAHLLNCTTMSAYCDARNSAVISLMERFGLTAQKSYLRLMHHG